MEFDGTDAQGYMIAAAGFVRVPCALLLDGLQDVLNGRSCSCFTYDR